MFLNCLDFYFTAPTSVNNAFKTVHLRGTGRSIRAKTGAYKNWIAQSAAKNILHKPAKPMAPGYMVELFIQRTSKQRDLDNYIKPILDFLVKFGVIEDDRFVMSIKAHYVEPQPGNHDVHCIVYGNCTQV